jgi:hypothetical protein
MFSLFSLDKEKIKQLIKYVIEMPENADNESRAFKQF